MSAIPQTPENESPENRPKSRQNRDRPKKTPTKPGKAAKRRRKDPEDADRIVLRLWTLASLKFLIRPVLRGQLIRRGRESTFRSMGPKSFSPNDKRGEKPNPGKQGHQKPPEKSPQKTATEGNPSKPPGARWIHKTGRKHFELEACKS